MGSPLVSVVVRCYNESEHIGTLLHGLTHQTVQDFEVVLVDSGSTDGTLEVAQDYGVDEIVYIDPKDFSFGRALNYGCEAASGEFCVIASAHVYPRYDTWLEKLLEKFDGEKVALSYGKQRGNETTKFSEKQILKTWFPEHDIDRQDDPFCNNANAAIRRELWERFPYNEQLTGLEDLDWAKRVQEAGYEISYAADAEVVHVHDETPGQILNRYRREAFAHKQVVPDQTFSLKDFFGAFFKNVFADYSTAARKGALLKNVAWIPLFRFLQFWGTYRGFSKDTQMSEQLRQRFFYPDRNSFPEGAEERERSCREIEYDSTESGSRQSRESETTPKGS